MARKAMRVNTPMTQLESRGRERGQKTAGAVSSDDVGADGQFTELGEGGRMSRHALFLRGSLRGSV